MGKILIIGEKPSLSKAIMSAISSTGEKFITKENGAYFESANYYITAAAGHLYELQQMKDYPGQETKWTLEALPFFPEKYEYIPMPSKIKRVNTIKQLLSDANEVIHAGDPGREGQLIIDIILRKLGYKGNVTRLWAQDIEPETILQQLRNRRPNSEYQLLFFEGSTRQIADWAYGINLSRYASLKSGTLLNVGRVVSAIIGIVCEREREIRNFVPVPFWQLELPLSEEVKLTSKTKNETFESGQEQLNKYNAAKTTVTKVIKKKVTKTPPKLFSQTKLQNAMSAAYGWTPDKTLKISQELYEKGYTTYPRTDSEYLSENEKDKVKRILAVHKFEHTVFKDVKRVFDSKKVDEHSAITPTAIVPTFTEKESDEAKCYEIIKNRFIVNFYDEDFIVEKTEITCDVVDEDTFYEEMSVSGEVVFQKGWSVLEKTKADRVLPAVKEGDDFSGRWDCIEKETKPPAYYTVTTLNNTLEKPFKNEKDHELTDDEEIEELKKLRSGISIGTDATRAGIIKKALDNGYMTLKNKTYRIEAKGEYLYDCLRELKIDMTKEKTVELSVAIRSVGRGEIKITDALNKIYDEISWIIKQDITPSSAEFGSLGECPLCGEQIVEGNKAYHCSNKECKFVVGKVIAKKLISKSNMEKLLSIGCTDVIKGFESKEGKKFDAALALREDKTGLEFKFNAVSGGQDILCPSCGSLIKQGNKAYYCSNKECNFVIWNVIAGKKITPAIVKKIVENGDSGKVSGFKSKKENAKKKTFSARLVLKIDKTGVEMQF